MAETRVVARLLAAIGALAVGAIAVTLAIVLAHRTPGPVAAATPSLPGAGRNVLPARNAIATSSPGFPAPPANAVVFAREDGPYALALALVPGEPLRLQTSLVDNQGRGVTGLRVGYSVFHERAVTRRVAVPCGRGCYSASVSLPSQPTRVDVAVAGKRATTVWRVALPEQWPPPDAKQLLAQAEETWRNLKTLVFRDHLQSDPTHAVNTVWRVVAPDNVAYDVEGGASAVIMGDTRWDKLPGQPWQKSPATRLHQPVPFWAKVTDAHVVGETTFAGAQVQRVTFFDPQTPAWFEVLIDQTSFRTLDLRMTTTAHFMHDTYTAFDTPVSIEPPSCASC